MVTTDACKFAIGAVKEQEFEDGVHLVCFASRVLNPAELNYAAHDLELLVIVDTIKAWRYYLHGRKLTVCTDHHPLKHLESQEHLSTRQVSWLERLSQYDFEIVMIKGKSNVTADGISRQKQSDTRKDQCGFELLKKLIRTNTLSYAISKCRLSSDFKKKTKERIHERW